MPLSFLTGIYASYIGGFFTFTIITDGAFRFGTLRAGLSSSSLLRLASCRFTTFSDVAVQTALTRWIRGRAHTGKDDAAPALVSLGQNGPARLLGPLIHNM